MPAAGDDPSRLTVLEGQMREVASRLAALERTVSRSLAPGPAGPAGPANGAAAPGAGPDPGRDSEEAAFSYSGQGLLGGSHVVVGQRGRLSDVLAAPPDLAARVFAALASPARIMLLRALLDGPRTTQQLRQELDDPSAGQLYHHLRELQAAGLVVQPGRSLYAITRGHEVALCIQIIAASQMGPAGLAE